MKNDVDPVWEKKYRSSPDYRNHYPWSEIVSFIISLYPDPNNRKDISILEVGCGNGPNLWFAAREGFNVFGIDSSRTAIDYAVDWFEKEKLNGEFRVGSFCNLPYSDQSFDVVIDRASLTLATLSGLSTALGECSRVLKPGGKLFFSPYSDHDSSFYRAPDLDHVVRGIDRGNHRGQGGQVLFLSSKDIRILLAADWHIERLIHISSVDFESKERTQNSFWNVIASKK